MNLDLATKPIARALITSAVKSIEPDASAATAAAPPTHQDLLQFGMTLTAQEITDTALLLLGRNRIASCDVLPEDAAVIIGFSIFVMLGIMQAVAKEGIALDVKELTERLIDRHLHRLRQNTRHDQSAQKQIADVALTATQIPSQIVETAKGEVEELFRRCYSVIPAYVRGVDEARVQLMTIFGTALHVLLHARVAPDS